MHPLHPGPGNTHCPYPRRFHPPQPRRSASQAWQFRVARGSNHSSPDFQGLFGSPHIAPECRVPDEEPVPSWRPAPGISDHSPMNHRRHHERRAFLAKGHLVVQADLFERGPRPGTGKPLLRRGGAVNRRDRRIGGILRERDAEQGERPATKRASRTVLHVRKTAASTGDLLRCRSQKHLPSTDLSSSSSSVIRPTGHTYRPTLPQRGPQGLFPLRPWRPSRKTKPCPMSPKRANSGPCCILQPKVSQQRCRRRRLRMLFQIARRLEKSSGLVPLE